MLEYAVIVLAVTLLTRITLLALNYYVDRREHPLSRITDTGQALHVAALSGVAALIPATIVLDGIDTGYFYTSLVVASASLLLIGWRITAISQHDQLEYDGAQNGFFRYQLQGFMNSWAGGVVMGALYGFLVTAARWSSELDFLVDVPRKSESQIYLYIFAGTITLSIGVFWGLSRRSFRRLPTAARLRRAVNYAWFSPAVIGLIVALIQNQTRNQTLANRYFTFIVLAWIVVAELWVLINVLPRTLRNLRQERKHFEEQQRLSKQKKRKKGRK